MPRATGVRQLPSKRCGCERCRTTYPTPERKPTKNCSAPWQARWYDASGQRQSVTRRTQAEALAEKIKAEAAIRAGTYQDPARGKITLADWHQIWLEGRSVERATRARDANHWSAHVAPRWGATPLRGISHQDVQTWVTGLEARLEAATIRSILNSLDMLLAAAQRDHRIPFNPCDGVRTKTPRRRHPTEDRPPTREQIQAAAECIPQSYYRRLPLFLLETGLRWGEAAGLLADCVDLEDRTVAVRRVLEEVGGKKALREYPKSDAGMRVIPLTRVAVELLREQLADDGMAPGQGVFRGRDGAYLGRNSYRSRVWLPATIAAGVHREEKRASGTLEHWPTIHDIRHTWASRLENAGVPESTRKELLGHNRPAGDVTWRYTHGAADVRDMVLRALGDEPEAAPVAAVPVADRRQVRRVKVRRKMAVGLIPISSLSEDSRG